MGLHSKMARLQNVVLSLSILGASLALPAQTPAADPQMQTDAQKELHGKQFRDVQVQVSGGVVTLTGQVDRLADKLDAEKRIARMHPDAIHNQIAVNVPSGITDAQLYQKLGKQLAYDREGYGTLPFNNITLQVENGVATVGGIVVNPTDKDSAIGLIANTPGVRGLVDNLKVAPVSPMDAQIRRAEFQAIYGPAQMTRYQVDPAKPIRIVVVNGHVTLVGVVQNQGDREFAGIRANGVPGVFSVTNDLQVAGQPGER